MLAWIFFLHFITSKYQKGACFLYAANYLLCLQELRWRISVWRLWCLHVSQWAVLMWAFFLMAVILRGKEEEILSVHSLSHRHYNINKGLLEKFRASCTAPLHPTEVVLFPCVQQWALRAEPLVSQALNKDGRDFLWKCITSEQQHIKIPKSTGSWCCAWSTQALH